MATRVNQTVVEDILQDDYGPNDNGDLPNLGRFIRGANLIVNRVATCAAAKNSALTGEELTEIEGWLAAHLFMMVARQTRSERNGTSSATFTGQTGMRLDATTYGQTAQTLDPSGCLAQITSGKQAPTVEWLGKEPPEQVPYVPRDFYRGS